MAQSPFPGYTADVTPESVQQQYEYARALRQGGGNGTHFDPVRHWSQGVSNIIQALMGGAEARKANEMAAQRGHAMTDPYSIPPTNVSPTTPAPATPAPAPAPVPGTPDAGTPGAGGTAGGAGINPVAMLNQGFTGGNLAPEKRSISAIESGSPEGNYLALGPRTRTGDRAYGRYQVMGANIPAWTASVLNYAETPQEFLHDKVAQDRVFEKKFKEYEDKYGPRGAALAWFGGEGAARGGNENITDRYISRRQYADRFMRGLNGGQPDTKVASAGGVTPVGNRNDQLNPTDRASVDAMYPPSSPQTGTDERSQIIAALQQGAQQGAPSGAGAAFGVSQPAETLPPTQVAAAGGGHAAPAVPGNPPAAGIPAGAQPLPPGQGIDPRKIPPRPGRITPQMIQAAGVAGAPQEQLIMMQQQMLNQNSPFPVPVGPNGKYGNIFIDPRSGAQFWVGNEFDETRKSSGGVEVPYHFRYNPDGSYFPLAPGKPPPGTPGAAQPQSSTQPAPTQTQPQPQKTAQAEPERPKGEVKALDYIESPYFKGQVKKFGTDAPKVEHEWEKDFPDAPADPTQFNNWAQKTDIQKKNAEVAYSEARKNTDKMTEAQAQALDRARTAAPQIETAQGIVSDPKNAHLFGPVGPFITELMKTANEAGSAASRAGFNFGEWSKFDTAPAEVYNKMVAGLVLESIRQMIGPNAGQFRVAELALANKAWGSQNMSPEANQAVMTIMSALNRRTLEYGALTNAYLRSHGGVIDEGYQDAMDAYSAANPLFAPDEKKRLESILDKKPEKGQSVNDYVRQAGVVGNKAPERGKGGWDIK